MTVKAKWAIPEKIQTDAWLKEDIFFLKKNPLNFEICGFINIPYKEKASSVEIVQNLTR